MNEVWVVIEDVQYDNREEIVGIYSTEEKAQQVVTDSFGMPGKPYYSIERWPVQ